MKNFNKKVVASSTKNKINNKSIKSKSTKKTHIIEKEELLPDGSLILKLSIPGRPATKKTHQRIFGGRIHPSKQYMSYEKHCASYCKDAWINLGKKPINCGISIHVRIFLNNWIVGDHVGYLQSLGDILQKHEVISDDKFIHWSDDGKHWFGGIDKDNPRVEIEIKRFRHPYETYREKNCILIKSNES